jgi:hypothetical protein
MQSNKNNTDHIKAEEKYRSNNKVNCMESIAIFSGSFIVFLYIHMAYNRCKRGENKLQYTCKRGKDTGVIGI